MFSSLFSDASAVIAADLNAYYDGLAEHQPLLFRDWRAAVQRESAALRRLLRKHNAQRVLDSSGTVGLHAIAAAMHATAVTAVCPTPAVLERAQHNAAQFRLEQAIAFLCADLNALSDSVTGSFDIALLKGGIVTHWLTDQAISAALSALHSLLRPEGVLILSLPAFDLLLEDRPRLVPRHVHENLPDGRAILFDLYDWQATEPLSVLHNIFIVRGDGDSFSATRFGVLQRALRRAELEQLLNTAGFVVQQAEMNGWELHITAERA
ncbi:MAG: class I SAM-dependent methyltransferase [Chloroflexota bacterium]|nr:MAG: class I SAM-dependent methyltransferase [Chloroflexota bacterium]